MSREFHLPDTIRLWDSLFACAHHANFLRYVCVTMLILVRDRILGADFAEILKILQNYPCENVDGILDSSNDLWKFDRDVVLKCNDGRSLREAIGLVDPPPGED